jgi:hypothetical protein
MASYRTIDAQRAPMCAPASNLCAGCLAGGARDTGAGVEHWMSNCWGGEAVGGSSGPVLPTRRRVHMPTGTVVCGASRCAARRAMRKLDE